VGWWDLGIIYFLGHLACVSLFDQKKLRQQKRGDILFVAEHIHTAIKGFGPSNL
jgi:hypothetical protein